IASPRRSVRAACPSNGSSRVASRSKKHPTRLRVSRPARPTRSRSWSTSEEGSDMKALVFEEPRRAAVRELDVPTIEAVEVLVRSRNVGICHSDFELYEGRYIIPVS